MRNLPALSETLVSKGNSRMRRMHHWTHYICLSIVFCWSFSSTAHKNPPDAAVPEIPIETLTDDTCLQNLLKQSPANPAAPQILPRNETPVFKLSVHDVVSAKLAYRVSKLKGPNDSLLSEKMQEDGQMHAPINDGITRLFMLQVVERMRREVVNNMTEYGKEWNKLRKEVLDSEQGASSSLRVRRKDVPLIFLDPDQDGYFDTPFLTKYKAKLEEMVGKMQPKQKEEFFSREKGGVRVQEMKLKEYLIRDAQSNLAKSQNEALVNAIVAELVDGESGMKNRYLRGQTSHPEWAVFENALQGLLDKYVFDLNQRFPIEKPLGMTLKPAPHARDYVVLDENGNISATFGDEVVAYQKEIAALVMTSPRQAQRPGRRLINLAEFHGVGSNQSNLVSYKELMAKATQSAFDPQAVDMPMSIGSNGLGANSIETPAEMDEYLNMIFGFVGKTAADRSLPMIALGRSMGATELAMSMYYSPKVGREVLPDLLYMMSFSDPATIETQKENLLFQYAQGQIKSVVENALDQAIRMTDQFKEEMKEVNLRDLSALEMQTQDRGIFAQGEADEDGVIPGSPPGAIITALKSHRDRFSPFAHVYAFEAPQLKYGEDWWKKYGIKPDISEGTHFLLSSVVNMTDKNRGHIPMEVPEKDLPKLEDQQFEVYALAYAMLDYQIDRSPITPMARRTELLRKRVIATGNHAPFAYLRWYVDEIVNPRQKQISTQPILSFQEIISNPNIHPGRDSGVYGRILRVYNFVLSEQQRVQDLLQQR
jgi:hypothetical protein